MILKSFPISFYLTAIYGSNDNIKREFLWKDIINLVSHIDSPWLITGDMNIFCLNSEILGKLPPSWKSMEDFSHVVHLAKLIEVEEKCSFYTLSNQQSGDDLIMSKFDQSLFNSYWLDLVPKFWLENVSSLNSDHYVQVIHLGLDVRKIHSPFKFIHAWVERDNVL